MSYLGIDFGLKKIGFAFSEGNLAEPLFVYKYQDINKTISLIVKLVKDKQITDIIIGISNGEMTKPTKYFRKKIFGETRIKPVFFDETLSTLEAVNYAVEANVNRQKRKDMEDAYAATIILQAYLDSKNRY